MSNRFKWFVATVIILTAGGRLVAIRVSVESPPDLIPIRDSVQDALRSGDFALARAHPSVDSIALERFDHDAVVILLPGPDGQPGVANTDDNGNAIVDDRTELGATLSDDICVVRSLETLDRQTSLTGLILQRGAFLGADSAQITPSDRVRAVVKGRSGDDRWSFLVSMP